MILGARSRARASSSARSAGGPSLSSARSLTEHGTRKCSPQTCGQPAASIRLRVPCALSLPAWRLQGLRAAACCGQMFPEVASAHLVLSISLPEWAGAEYSNCSPCTSVQLESHDRQPRRWVAYSTWVQESTNTGGARLSLAVGLGANASGLACSATTESASSNFGHWQSMPRPNLLMQM